eukprot:Hpha_TRINITY_DN16818_c0_g4::TRINITY_DN16818_c0_g4_i2::g.148352::m.148352/K07937/ARF1; ADP-ribosylation factor 1
MGGTLRKLLPGEKEAKVLMMGLDAAGKTTMLHKLGWDPGAAVITGVIGWSVEEVSFKNINLTSWDFGYGGSATDKLRPLLRRHYYPGTDGLILFVDANDRGRIGDVRCELQKVLQEELLRDACLLVFANKQDLQNAMSTAEVIDTLELDSIDRRKWHILGDSRGQFSSVGQRRGVAR